MLPHMTKSTKKAVTTPKNNIPSYDKICHIMSQSMWREGGRKEEVSQLIDALQKIGYFKSFQVSEKHDFTTEKHVKTQPRTLKRRNKAVYRRIKKYYKSTRQYKKERLRRKLCWLLSGKYKETEIAEMLGISVRTVIRDMNKIKPYYFRMSRAYFNQMEQDRIKEMKLKLEGKSVFEQLDILTAAMIESRNLFKVRQYRRHFQIMLIDMTQLNYGIPKITFTPRTAQTLAYPYRIRIHVKVKVGDGGFTHDEGGLVITQSTRGLWYL